MQFVHLCVTLHQSDQLGDWNVVTFRPTAHQGTRFAEAYLIANDHGKPHLEIDANVLGKPHEIIRKLDYLWPIKTTYG